jgi:hypothetical protein
MRKVFIIILLLFVAASPAAALAETPTVKPAEWITRLAQHINQWFEAVTGADQAEASDPPVVLPLPGEGESIQTDDDPPPETGGEIGGGWDPDG